MFYKSGPADVIRSFSPPFLKSLCRRSLQNNKRSLGKLKVATTVVPALLYLMHLTCTWCFTWDRLTACINYIGSTVNICQEECWISPFCYSSCSTPSYVRDGGTKHRVGNSCQDIYYRPLALVSCHFIPTVLVSLESQ